MKKYMGNKKEVLLFYLLMIAVIGWFVVAGDSVSVRTYQSFQTGESYIQGDIYLAKRSMMTLWTEAYYIRLTVGRIL